VANQYVMYQGIPFDGDTPQPMFEAKWDVCPIKVVAQADYDALAAELRASIRMGECTADKLADMTADYHRWHQAYCDAKYPESVPLSWQQTAAALKVAESRIATLEAQLAESRRKHDETSIKWQTRVDQCDALEAELTNYKANARSADALEEQLERKYARIALLETALKRYAHHDFWKCDAVKVQTDELDQIVDTRLPCTCGLVEVLATLETGTELGTPQGEAGDRAGPRVSPPLETPLRRAHSKSEQKRLTALGVECVVREPPHCASCSCGLTQETGAKHED
jgi:hypothetical protein